MFSIAAAPFYTSSAQRFQFLYIITSTCYLLIFIDVRHPNIYEVVSCCCFDLHFPND